MSGSQQQNRLDRFTLANSRMVPSLSAFKYLQGNILSIRNSLNWVFTQPCHQRNEMLCKKLTVPLSFFDFDDHLPPQHIPLRDFLLPLETVAGKSSRCKELRCFRVTSITFIFSFNNSNIK